MALCQAVGDSERLADGTEAVCMLSCLFNSIVGVS